MAVRDYLWDHSAHQSIVGKGLHNWYHANQKYYDALAGNMWGMVRAGAGAGAPLKGADLYIVLLPLIHIDALTIEGMEKRRIKEPGSYGSSQWYAWFTYYIVEQFWPTRSGGTS